MFYRLECVDPTDDSASSMLTAVAALSALINRVYEDDTAPPQLGTREAWGMNIFLEMTANTLDHLSGRVARMEEELDRRRLADIEAERAERDAATAVDLKDRAAKAVQDALDRLPGMVDAELDEIVKRKAAQRAVDAPPAPDLTEPARQTPGEGQRINAPLRGRTAG